jgi:hypothetical protein
MYQRNTIFLLTIFLFFSTAQAQEYNFTGLLRLNDSLMISYKVQLQEQNGIVNGHSITDYGGEHETKSLIKGRYSDQSSTLSFSEYGIVYTKSPVEAKDFCYVNFVGKINSMDATKIDGNFRGKFSDGETCINGELVLMNDEQMNKISQKIDKKIQNKKKLKKYADQEISIKKAMDTISQSQLKSGEKLSFFSKATNLTLVLDDAGEADGDRVTISQNGNVILRNQLIAKEPKELRLVIDQYPTIIKVSALNSGEIAPNTINIQLKDQDKLLKTLSNLKAGESSQLIIRQP